MNSKIRYIVINGYLNTDNMKVYTDETLPEEHRKAFNEIAANDKGYAYNGHSKLLQIITTDKITLSQILTWQKVEPIELPPKAIEAFGEFFSRGHQAVAEQLKKQISYLWVMRPHIQFDDVVLDLDTMTWDYTGSHVEDVASRLIYW